MQKLFGGKKKKCFFPSFSATTYAQNQLYSDVCPTQHHGFRGKSALLLWLRIWGTYLRPKLAVAAFLMIIIICVSASLYSLASPFSKPWVIERLHPPGLSFFKPGRFYRPVLFSRWTSVWLVTTLIILTQILTKDSLFYVPVKRENRMDLKHSFFNFFTSLEPNRNIIYTWFWFVPPQKINDVMSIGPKLPCFRTFDSALITVTCISS